MAFARLRRGAPCTGTGRPGEALLLFLDNGALIKLWPFRSLPGHRPRPLSPAPPSLQDSQRRGSARPPCPVPRVRGPPRGSARPLRPVPRGGPGPGLVDGARLAESWGGVRWALQGDGAKTREAVFADIKGESLTFSLLSRASIQTVIVPLRSWRKLVCLFVCFKYINGAGQGHRQAEHGRISGRRSYSALRP